MSSAVARTLRSPRVAPASRSAQEPPSDAGRNKRGHRDDGRHDRLRVEELRHREKEREADQQRAVARAARLEELDADQDVEELRRRGRAPGSSRSSARMPIAAATANPGSSQRRRLRRLFAVERESDSRDDERGTDEGDPTVDVSPQRHLRAEQQCRKRAEFARARERRRYDFSAVTSDSAGRTRPARPAQRGGARRPVRAVASVPGSRNPNGRASRSAASTHAVRRDSRISSSRADGSSLQSRSMAPPPAPPSNCLVYQPPPRATAFHAMRLCGSPRS